MCIVEIKFYYTQKMLRILNIINLIDPKLDVRYIIIQLQVCLSGSYIIYIYIAITYLDITISNNIVSRVYIVHN